jgi:hypothetical protein
VDHCRPLSQKGKLHEPLAAVNVFNSCIGKNACKQDTDRKKNERRFGKGKSLLGFKYPVVLHRISPWTEDWLIWMMNQLELCSTTRMVFNNIAIFLPKKPITL